MDIYNFINSKDIADYLKSINYNFSIIEAFYIVYQCHNTTLKQKIEAWQEIIKTYPDCSYKRKRIDIESMHQFLRSYIFLKQSVNVNIKMFKKWKIKMYSFPTFIPQFVPLYRLAFL